MFHLCEFSEKSGSSRKRPFPRYNKRNTFKDLWEVRKYNQDTWKGDSEMNINQLIYFRAICQEKSVTKAAETLHVSQPSISNALKNLEEDLQVSLFIRDHKKLILTQTGEFFLEKADHILNLFEHLHEDVEAFEKNNKYTIKIGISVPDTKTFEQRFTALQPDHPQVQFDFQEHSKTAIKSLVENDALDFGIIFLEPEDEETFSHVLLTRMHIHLEDAPSLPEKQDQPPKTPDSFSCNIGLIWQKEKKPALPVEKLWWSHDEQHPAE